MEPLVDLLSIYAEVSKVNSIGSILSWDQNTYMPPGAAADRGAQMAYLSQISHRLITSEKVGKLLGELRKVELDPVKSAMVREIERLHRRKTAIPEDLEAEIAGLEPISTQAWVEAKKKDRFDIFSPHLTRMLELKKELAEKVGYPDVPYDALLEEYEPYTTTGQVREVLNRLGEELAPMVRKLADFKADNRMNMKWGKYAPEAQERIYTSILEDMGYDFGRGRLDSSEHPFTIGSNDDVRITTHYMLDDPRPALFSCIHEGGHALYEQGFHIRYKNTPMAEFCSLGIHESQSRLWENIIGRSIHFWKHYYPLLRGAFPGLSNMTLEHFHRSINTVKPSLIRVEADEVTYNLHIIIRFEIEIDMIEGKLSVKEIPQAWSDLYEKYLGIRPKTDSEGCLQDIHWAMGVFGYFPTYALGNLYSAQFYNAMKKQHPDIERLISEGDLRTALVWLRANIHEKGKLYPASELVKIVTGEHLNADHFIDYLKDKYGTLYNVYF